MRHKCAKWVKDKRKYAQWCQLTRPEMQAHDKQPGDKVLIKVFF